MSGRMQDIIIDTDPGHDDAMAIMLAAKSGKFNIRAITTVAGNSTVENTTRNARYVSELIGLKGVPIYSGSAKPLRRKLVKAVVHGESGLAGIDPTNDPLLTGDAVDRILEIVRGSPGRVTMVTIGPMTNVARAILKDRSTMLKLKGIVSMAGAIRVPGNKNRVAEFNVFVDPEAADTVLRLEVPRTMVPLDACNGVRMRLTDFQRIRNARIRDALVAMAVPYIENIAAYEGIKAALMYDPLTVYSLINPSACIAKNYDILVETRGELTRGMTVPDLRPGHGAAGNVSVVEGISEEDFKRDFIEYLSR